MEFVFDGRCAFVVAHLGMARLADDALGLHGEAGWVR